MSKSSNIQIISASLEEYKSGVWSPENITKIIDGMAQDGIVVLEGTTDSNHIDKLNAYMEENAKYLRARATRLNFGIENIQQGAPLHIPELIFDDIVGNSLLYEAVRSILGPNARFEFFSGNTAMAGNTQRQPVHSDTRCFTRDETFFLIANIPLIDLSTDTGSTEIWPGTHKLRQKTYFAPEKNIVLPEILEQRYKARPPLQPNIPKGSIILRDLTMWHCGVPNPSDKIRCMPALGFGASWYKTMSSEVVVPSHEVFDRLKKNAEHSGLKFVGKVVPQEEYLAQIDAHTFKLGEASSYEPETL